MSPKTKEMLSALGYVNLAIMGVGLFLVFLASRGFGGEPLAVVGAWMFFGPGVLGSIIALYGVWTFITGSYKDDAS